MSTDFDLITSNCTSQDYCTFLGGLSQPLSSRMINQVIFHFLPDELLGIILGRLMIITRLLNNPLHCCLHSMASVVGCKKKNVEVYPGGLLPSCHTHENFSFGINILPTTVMVMVRYKLGFPPG